MRDFEGLSPYRLIDTAMGTPGASGRVCFSSDRWPELVTFIRESGSNVDQWRIFRLLYNNCVSFLRELFVGEYGVMIPIPEEDIKSVLKSLECVMRRALVFMNDCDIDGRPTEGALEIMTANLPLMQEMMLAAIRDLEIDLLRERQHGDVLDVLGDIFKFGGENFRRTIFQHGKGRN